MVLNGIGIVAIGRIGVGNGDGLPTRNGPGERELNGGAKGGNSLDGIGKPA